MDISHVELKSLEAPSDYIDKVEAGRLILKDGRRFSIEVMGHDVSRFTLADWEFVASKMVAILLKKRLLQKTEFSGATINDQGVEDYQTQKLYRHDSEVQTLAEWRSIKRYFHSTPELEVKTAVVQKVKSSLKYLGSRLLASASYWANPLINITSLNLV